MLMETVPPIPGCTPIVARKCRTYPICTLPIAKTDVAYSCACKWCAGIRPSSPLSEYCMPF